MQSRHSVSYNNFHFHIDRTVSAGSRKGAYMDEINEKNEKPKSQLAVLPLLRAPLKMRRIKILNYNSIFITFCRINENAEDIARAPSNGPIRALWNMICLDGVIRD